MQVFAILELLPRLRELKFDRKYLLLYGALWPVGAINAADALRPRDQALSYAMTPAMKVNWI